MPEYEVIFLNAAGEMMGAAIQKAASLPAAITAFHDIIMARTPDFGAGIAGVRAHRRLWSEQQDNPDPYGQTGKSAP